jgi:hypothetical protein
VPTLLEELRGAASTDHRTEPLVERRMVLLLCSTEHTTDTLRAFATRTKEVFGERGLALDFDDRFTRVMKMALVGCRRDRVLQRR